MSYGSGNRTGIGTENRESEYEEYGCEMLHMWQPISRLHEPPVNDIVQEKFMQCMVTAGRFVMVL